MKRKDGFAPVSLPRVFTLIPALFIFLTLSGCSSEQQLIEQVEGKDFKPFLFDPTGRETTRRSTYVKLNINTFESLLSNPASLASIELVLFPNERLTVVDSKIEKSKKGNYRWTGNIVAEKYGHLALTVSSRV